MSFDEVTKQIELELHNTSRGEAYYPLCARITKKTQNFDVLFHLNLLTRLCFSLQLQ